MYIKNLNDLNIMVRCEYEIIAYLQFYSLVKSNVLCPHCSRNCDLYRDRRNYRFRCCKNKKKFQVSLAKDTWFHSSHLSYSQVLYIIYYFVHNFPVTQCAFDFELSTRTCIDWYIYCGEVCINACLQSGYDLIGGPGKYVELYESSFGRRKCHSIRGNRVEGPFVLGAFERGENKKYFFDTISQRDAVSIYTIISERIIPGTTIISDLWKSFNLSTNNYFNDLMIKYKIKFVDIETDMHTYSEDDSWFLGKNSIPPCGRRKEFFLTYLAKYLWVSSVPEEERFQEFISEIGKLYPQEL